MIYQNKRYLYLNIKTKTMIFTFTAGDQTVTIEEKNEKRALKKALKDMDFKGAWSKENKTKKNVTEKVAKRTKSNFATTGVEKEVYVPTESIETDWILKVIKRCQTTTKFVIVCNTLQMEGILEVREWESSKYDLQVGIHRGGWVITYKGVGYAYIEPAKEVIKEVIPVYPASVQTHIDFINSLPICVDDAVKLIIEKYGESEPFNYKTKIYKDIKRDGMSLMILDQGDDRITYRIFFDGDYIMNKQVYGTVEAQREYDECKGQWHEEYVSTRHARNRD